MEAVHHDYHQLCHEMIEDGIEHISSWLLPCWVESTSAKLASSCRLSGWQQSSRGVSSFNCLSVDIPMNFLQGREMVIFPIFAGEL
jgi:hypothetical protein